jgi:hypothetical protein
MSKKFNMVKHTKKPYAILKRLSSNGNSLYIGDYRASKAVSNDTKRCITISAFPPKDIRPMYLIEFDDKMGDEEGNEVQFAKECIIKGSDYLEKAMQSTNTNIVVNCWAGKNRSASIIAAYAIRYCNWTSLKAKNYLRGCVKRQRNESGVLQNKVFQAILKDFDADRLLEIIHL